MYNKNCFSLLAVFLLALSVVLTSCSKDEDPKGITKDQLIAVWKLNSYKVVVSAAGTSTPATTETGTGETLELKSDGTAIFKDTDGTSQQGTWTLSGTKLTLEGTYEGSYEVKEASSKLTLYAVEEVAFLGVQMKTETNLSFNK